MLAFGLQPVIFAVLLDIILNHPFARRPAIPVYGALVLVHDFAL
jgi:hypothetical protein